MFVTIRFGHSNILAKLHIMDHQQKTEICSILANPDSLAFWCSAHCVGINHGRRLLRSALYNNKDLNLVASKKQLTKEVFRREEARLEKQKDEEYRKRLREDLYAVSNGNESLDWEKDFDVDMG